MPRQLWVSLANFDCEEKTYAAENKSQWLLLISGQLDERIVNVPCTRIWNRRDGLTLNPRKVLIFIFQAIQPFRIY